MYTSNPKNILAIISSSQDEFSYKLKNVPADQNKIIIGVTMITKTNVESNLSRYIYLERKQDGWQISSNASNN